MIEDTAAQAGVDTWMPESIAEAAEMLANADDRDVRVRISGGGTCRDIGHAVEHDVVLSTQRLNQLVAWEPDDLTAVVECGMQVEEFERTLAGAGQSAVLPERAHLSTVGGVVASGRSGWRRLRYGPISDRMLEVTLVTGDGRIVTAGGRLVKNVTGYDIARLAVGSLGSIGLIARVCMKLWPIPAAAATVRVESSAAAIDSTFRPLAILETRDGVDVFLSGTGDEVDGQADRLAGERTDGHRWPDPPESPVAVSVRVPPSEMERAIEMFDPAWRFVAQHGVGEVTVGADEITADRVVALRALAESRGGNLVIIRPDPAWREQVDPWGAPPPSLAIQRRVVAQFDPLRRLNPGILPGGL